MTIDFNTSTAGATSILPAEFSNLVQEPLQQNSVAYNPLVSKVFLAAGHTLHIPVVAKDANAAWVAEGQEIETSAPELIDTEVKFYKVAGLIPISRELANDSNPEALALAGNSLSRDIAAKIDGALFGAEKAANAPEGLATITPTEITGALNSLDVFAEAIKAAAEHGATVEAFVMNPVDMLTVRKLKTGFGQLSPLLGNANDNLGATVFGVPLIASNHVPAGTFWAIDPAALIVAQREPVQLAVSEDVYFTQDSVAIRAVSRVGFAFPRPEALVKVTISEAEAEEPAA